MLPDRSITAARKDEQRRFGLPTGDGV